VDRDVSGGDRLFPGRMKRAALQERNQSAGSLKRLRIVDEADSRRLQKPERHPCWAVV
jgi:hypothetical protein